MTLRLPITAFVALALLMGACGSESSNPAASSSNTERVIPPSVQNPAGLANATIDELGEAINHFLLDPYPATPASVSVADREGWTAFYEEGDRRLAAIEAAFDRWRTNYNAARADGAPPEMADGVNGDELQAVLGTWIDAQVEQAALSRSCVLESAAPDDCLFEVTVANTDRWNQVAADLNRVMTGG